MNKPGQNIPPPQKTKFPPAPAGYIPGFGRGATGFMTRSDIGPMRTPDLNPMIGAMPVGYVAGVGRGAAGINTAPPDADGDRGDYSESKYDAWGGYEGSLFANYGDYDEEDKEADDTYSQVDFYMDGRRKVRREKLLKEELQKVRQEKPPVSQLFSDLKRNLVKLSQDDWNSIPDIGDYSVKKIKKDKYVPVPDNIIESALKEGQTMTSIVDTGATPLGTETSRANLNEFGEARGTVLSLKLDKVGDSVTGQSVVDPKGYLTSLNSLPINFDADIGDIKKARLLLKSVIDTNPAHAPGWIAAGRLEELDGKLQTARGIIVQGLQHCTNSEDLWLEAARLETPEKARAVLAKAATNMPHSVKIWLAAASKEPEKATKIKILRRALQYIPDSVKLWRELIEMENPEEAKELLYRAVECVPHSLEMWLALAKLEDYENARVVLNRARTALPMESSIWIHAAKLEETQGNEENVGILIKRGTRTLQKNGVAIKREEWLKEAETAEKAGSIMTGRAIINATIDIGLDEDDREKALIDDIAGCISRNNLETARAIYYYLVNCFPEKQDLWLRAVEFEKKYGNVAKLDDILKLAMEKCPKYEIFFLMAAKHKWKQGKLEDTIKILDKAFEAHINNENIYLAKAKIHREIGEYDKAKELLAKARDVCNTPRIWMQSVQIERETLNDTEAWKLCEEALKRHQLFPKLWMIAGQLQLQINNVEKARKIFEKGLEFNKNSVPLWICAIHLEEEQRNFAKARSIWEKARLQNPNNPDLWYTAIKLEEHDDNPAGAKYNLSRGLQECPKNGELWALSIEMAPKQQRHPKSVEAIQHCDNDPHVVLAVAKLFWKDKKYEKARKWLERAVQINVDYGDAWIYYYKFEKDHGNPTYLDVIKDKVKEAEPHHGRLWIKISKQLGNWRLIPSEILVKAAKYIENEFNIIE